jgi:hypothetical protein
MEAACRFLMRVGLSRGCLQEPSLVSGRGRPRHLENGPVWTRERGLGPSPWVWAWILVPLMGLGQDLSLSLTKPPFFFICKRRTIAAPAL